jgi:hypothetical protein
MKNIHVLPTEKGTGSLAKSPNTKYYVVSDHNRGISDHIDYNIYITNLEKTKLGEWVIYTKGIKIHCKKLDNKEDVELANIENSGVLKIILTTDQNLIKDGVRAIDDKFLEWFVKNPNCEYVVVKKFATSKMLIESPSTKVHYMGYKIIIPKEEPKQETLEEASDRIRKELIHAPIGIIPNFNDGFEQGVKWQQEQDKNKFSEVFEWLANKDYLSDEVDIIQKEFEQFKKK